ncbi:uncharacterized protein C8Q71DRAFT_770469 [Rhodofomes roseus]|uniref:Uncharacterized protein n=1 Tax=Rhodofomes roseus TaxID=34475 RepID=A0ABQ8K9D6_9APHY|nr:uncharacterized protein C8Q71DRAFT_770469 [Rhodofomes roseus]KAH9833996.1 hypothetical protein C8Q71DRAFT_770469 [Rhodofomes roseus]
MATLHANGGAVSSPSNGGPIDTISSLDFGVIHQMLGLMKGSCATIGQQSKTIDEQSARVTMLGPSKESLKHQVEELEREIRSTRDKHDKGIEHFRSTVKDKMKETIARQMKNDIEAQIRKQVAEQVNARLAVHIRRHLPVPLKDQVEESRRQIEEVKQAFQNSEARRMNSGLKTNHLDETLAIVLKRDGTRSALWPENLRSLFAYTPEQVRDLMAEYGLGGNGDRERNINKFMAHIGVSFPLLWVSVPGVGSGSAATSPVVNGRT